MPSKMTVAAEKLLGEKPEIKSGHAGCKIYQLTPTLAVAVFDRVALMKDGSAKLLINDGRAWWQAGDRPEAFEARFPFYEGETFLYDHKELKAWLAKVEEQCVEAGETEEIDHIHENVTIHFRDENVADFKFRGQDYRLERTEFGSRVQCGEDAVLEFDHELLEDSKQIKMVKVRSAAGPVGRMIRDDWGSWMYLTKPNMTRYMLDVYGITRALAIVAAMHISGHKTTA